MSKRNESIISFNNRLFETAKMMPRGEGMNMIGIIYSNIKEFISVRLCREEDWDEYEDDYNKCIKFLCNNIGSYVKRSYSVLNDDCIIGFKITRRKFADNFQLIPDEYSISNLENGFYLFNPEDKCIFKCKKRGFFVEMYGIYEEPVVFIRSEIIFQYIFGFRRNVIPFEIIRNHGTQPDIHSEKDIVGYIDALKMEPICNIMIGKDPTKIFYKHILSDMKSNPNCYVLQREPNSIITDLKINSLVQFDMIAKEIYKHTKNEECDVNDIFFIGGDKQMMIWNDDESNIIMRTPEIDFNIIMSVLLYSHDSRIDEIYISLYRFDIDTKFPVKALCDLSKSGVNVNVFLEAKARDNEENALEALSKFKEAGVNVVLAYPNKKVHAKLALIKYKDTIMNTSVMRAHIGTGNYSESSQKCFHDLHFITYDAKYTMQVYRVLKGLMNRSIQENDIVSNNRERIVSLIESEMHKSHNGKIIFKCNNICDEEIIQKLYDAADAGVSINIIVRTVCTIRDRHNLRVMSVCGQYLEHDRIYQFGDRVFISSSDIMNRNLDHRIETFVELPEYLAQCISEDILEHYINLNSKPNGSIIIWDMKDGAWIKRTNMRK